MLPAITLAVAGTAACQTSDAANTAGDAVASNCTFILTRSACCQPSYMAKFSNTSEFQACSAPERATRNQFLAPQLKLQFSIFFFLTDARLS
jgi:hypothetical protein